MGLKQTGIVAGATLKAMNVPAERAVQGARRRAPTVSPARISRSATATSSVNLPSTSVEAVDNGTVAHRYVAIVGDPDHPSPEIAAHVQVGQPQPDLDGADLDHQEGDHPAHAARSGLSQRARRSASSTARAQEINPKAIDWSTERAANYTLRQDSGAGNSLGSIRIDMPNKLAVYMHDTPSKRLFGADYRFLSHGCVRVQGVYDWPNGCSRERGGPAAPGTRPRCRRR